MKGKFHRSEEFPFPNFGAKIVLTAALAHWVVRVSC